MSIQKGSSQGNPHRHKANLIRLLKPWANKRAGLLYAAHMAIKQYAEYGADSTVSDVQRYILLRDTVLVISYITAAKNCLTQQVKDMIVDSLLGYGAGLVSKDDLYKLVETGSNMPEVAFDFYMKQDRNIAGQSIDKTILYLSLLFSGVDGLNTEEIIRFLKVGRHMGVSEKVLNNLLVTYFHEISLMEAFNTHSKL